MGMGMGWGEKSRIEGIKSLRINHVIVRSLTFPPREEGSQIDKHHHAFTTPSPTPKSHVDHFRPLSLSLEPVSLTHPIISQVKTEHGMALPIRGFQGIIEMFEGILSMD